MLQNVPAEAIQGLSTKRVEALADGVFAIAMTLLVLNIKVPLLQDSNSNTGLLQQMLTLFPVLFDYALSFILLAVFWIIHQSQFALIKTVNRGLLWINIFILMFAALIPFSTMLASQYPNLIVSELFLELNIFIIGIVLYFHWIYITKDKRFIVEHLTHERIARAKKKSLILPVLALCAIGIAFVNPQWSSIPYVLIPVIMMRFKKKK